MAKELHNADEVLKEKYEERGWNQEHYFNSRMSLSQPIKPLPISEEEYRNFSLSLAKLALQDENSMLCEIYFELQRCALYGNGYSFIEEMSEIEQRMWSLGTGEKIDTIEKRGI